MKMNILQIQIRFPPAVGGAERHVYLLSKYLIKKGHQVVVCTTNSMSKKDVKSITLIPPFIIPEQEKKKKLPSNDIIEGIMVKRFDFKIRYWSFTWIPEMFKYLKEKLKDFDIIHAHGYHIFTSLVGCYFARKHGKPFILTAHDLIIHQEVTIPARIFRRIYNKTLGKWLLANASRLIALTEDQIEQYLALYSSGAQRRKIRIVPNGIELTRYTNFDNLEENIGKLQRKYGISGDEKILLFVGRIEKYKGLQDIILILPDLLKRVPNLRLVIIGKDYGFKEELKNIINSLMIQDRVIFTGQISEKELLTWYHRADIFVFPSKMEGFGIVLLEAMATKTLPIAYDIPSVRKVILNKHNGVLSNTMMDFYENILHYLINPKEKRKIEKKAFISVQKFDIEKVINKIEKIYKEVYKDEASPNWKFFEPR